MIIKTPKKGFSVVAYNQQKRNRCPYATLEQMQQMEFGVTGITRKIEDSTFELLEGDGGLHGWAQTYLDDNGNVADWDRVPEGEARTLGLIK